MDLTFQNVLRRESLQDSIDDLRNSIARTETLLREDKERLSFCWRI